MKIELATVLYALCIVQIQSKAVEEPVPQELQEALKSLIYVPESQQLKEAVDPLPFESKQLQGLLDTIIRIVNNLEDWIQSGLEHIKVSAQDSSKILRSISNSIVTATSALLHNIQDDLKADLDKLKNQTNAAGKKLIDCLESNGDAVVAVPVHLVNSSLNCVNVQYGQVAAVIPPAIDQLQDIIRKVHNTTNQLEECNKLNLIQLIACVRKVGAEVSRDVAPIGQIVTKLVDDLDKAIEEHLVKQTGACVKRQVNATRTEALSVFNQIANCAVKS